MKNYTSAVGHNQAQGIGLNSLLNYNSSQNSRKPLPMFALAGRIEQLDKEEETVAMPTARNHSPEEGDESARFTKPGPAILPQNPGNEFTNEQDLPRANSNFAMKTINQLIYSDQSPAE